MRLAVMQPYFYPYLGYFELIRHVDVFVFFTDVQYIRRGWVNRNRIRAANARGWEYLTVPVEHAPRSTPISDIRTRPGWQADHRKKLEYAYGRNKIRDHEFSATLSPTDPGLCDTLTRTIADTARWLGLGTLFRDSREFAAEGKGQDRILDICRQARADTYVNLPGGQGLYSPEEFSRRGLALEILPLTGHANKLSVLDLIFGDGLRNI